MTKKKFSQKLLRSNVRGDNGVIVINEIIQRGNYRECNTQIYIIMP